MSDPISKTFTEAELQAAASAFVQQRGTGQELEWRWERQGMFLEFIGSLFADPAAPAEAGTPNFSNLVFQAKNDGETLTIGFDLGQHVPTPSDVEALRSCVLKANPWATPEMIQVVYPSESTLLKP